MRSLTGSLDAPTSRPSKTCTLSALTISPFSADAIRRLRLVFPTAVGPAITKTLGSPADVDASSVARTASVRLEPWHAGRRGAHGRVRKAAWWAHSRIANRDIAARALRLFLRRGEVPTSGDRRKIRTQIGTN